MSLKARTPTVRAARQGLGLESHFPATSNISPTIFAVTAQDSIAVRRLVSRFGMPPATALAVAELAGWRS